MYILEKGSGTWTQTQKIVAPDRAADDAFGYGVAINGDYIIVGAYLEDEDINGLNTKNGAGSAYIYERTSGSPNWSYTQKIVPTVRHGNANFGLAVDIEGDYAIIRAQGEGYDTNNSNYLANSGAAYIFERNGLGIWKQENKLVASDRAAKDRFGHSVAISSDGYAVVSAFREDEDENGNDSLFDAGSAYIFVRGTSSPYNWTEQQKIVASDRAVGDNFGRNVSIDGFYVVVGAYKEDHDANGGDTENDAGSVYVFYRNGTTWSEQQKLVAHDRNEGDNFGVRVDIRGNYIVVGASSERENSCGVESKFGAGSAYLFRREGTIWIQENKLTPSDRAVSDAFAHSVSIDEDLQILIGAHAEDNDENGNDTLDAAGSAYVFELNQLGCLPPSIRKKFYLINDINGSYSDEKELIIYPNPTADGNFMLKFNQTLNEGSVYIEVYSSTGKLLHKEMNIINVQGVPISLKNINPGLYLIIANYKDNRFSKKLIVK